MQANLYFGGGRGAVSKWELSRTCCYGTVPSMSWPEMDRYCLMLLCLQQCLWLRCSELMSIIVQRDATIYSLLYFCKLLYMFRSVTPPIIRSTYNCNHNIWHCSNRRCYLPLLWSSCSTTTERSWDGLTNARCYDYSYMCSWWWVELPPETYRASSLQKYNKLYIVASS